MLLNFWAGNPRRLCCDRKKCVISLKPHDGPQAGSVQSSSFPLYYRRPLSARPSTGRWVTSQPPSCCPLASSGKNAASGQAASDHPPGPLRHLLPPLCSCLLIEAVMPPLMTPNSWPHSSSAQHLCCWPCANRELSFPFSASPWGAQQTACPCLAQITLC